MIGDTFWPLFGNLGLIFCIGITYGLARDKKSEAALVAVMCFIMFLGANASYLQLSGQVAQKINGEHYGTGQTELLGFTVVDMGIFLGLILGVTIAGCITACATSSWAACSRCTAAPSWC